ncbi:MAG: pirin family protein [Deltaproteobacteria bacterium]|nr:MAG: pirin family protein [Deltaproteobacteria bacterium]
MKQLRRSNDRGLGDHGWLHSRHTFSFAGYYDPEHMGFRSLRVINEDQVEPGRGFGTHPHRDMEIISYVLDGALEHADSMGTGSVIRPGDVQRMSAGTGVRHSEYNHSKSDSVHFLQIWIEPEAKGIEPSYEQKTYPKGEKQGKLRLVGSRDGRDGSVVIHQDVNLYASALDGDDLVTYEVPEGRYTWLHVAKGSLQVNGETLNAGDAIATDNEEHLVLSDGQSAEVLIFDLA